MHELKAGAGYPSRACLLLATLGLASWAATARGQVDQGPSEQEVAEACRMLHPMYRQECIEAGGPRARLERRRPERRAAPYVPEGLAPETLRYNGPRRSASRDRGRGYAPEGLDPESTRYNGPALAPSKNRDRPYVPEGLPPETLRYNGPARSASRDPDRPYVPEGLPPETLGYNGPARPASSEKSRPYVPEGLPPETLRYNGPSRPSSSDKNRNYVPEGLPPESLRYNGPAQPASRDSKATSRSNGYSYHPNSSQGRAERQGHSQANSPLMPVSGSARSASACPGLVGQAKRDCLNADLRRGLEEAARIRQANRRWDSAISLVCDFRKIGSYAESAFFIGRSAVTKAGKTAVRRQSVTEAVKAGVNEGTGIPTSAFELGAFVGDYLTENPNACSNVAR